MLMLFLFDLLRCIQPSQRYRPVFEVLLSVLPVRRNKVLDKGRHSDVIQGEKQMRPVRFVKSHPSQQTDTRLTAVSLARTSIKAKDSRRQG